MNSLPGGTIAGIPLNGVLLPSNDQTAAAFATADKYVAMMQSVPVVSQLTHTANNAYQQQALMSGYTPSYAQTSPYVPVTSSPMGSTLNYIPSQPAPMAPLSSTPHATSSTTTSGGSVISLLGQVLNKVQNVVSVSSPTSTHTTQAKGSDIDDDQDHDHSEKRSWTPPGLAKFDGVPPGHRKHKHKHKHHGKCKAHGEH